MESSVADGVTLKRHRKTNPQGCQRCRDHRRLVPAEWNLKPDGKGTMYLCEPHARYWAAKEGLEVSEGAPLQPTP